MFSGISVMIWGMIAAKAKTGLNAAESGQIKSVSAALQQTFSLIVMIAVASGINIYTSMDDLSSNSLAQASSASAGRQLMSVDTNLAQEANTLTVPRIFGDVVPQVSDYINLEQVEQVKTASMDYIVKNFDKKTMKDAAKKALQNQHSQRQFKEVTAFLMFILTTGISIAYYVTFKTYHTAVAKMESLKKLLSNPNARVAAGKKGKDILKRVS